MTEVLERTTTAAESITPEMMRVAIRSKLRDGVNKQQICWLVMAYAPANETHDRREGPVLRLLVETIPNEKRRAFLDSLSRLSNLRSPRPEKRA